MHSKAKKMVLTALMASMVCVVTMLVQIPSPLKGYVNIGDCIVLLCGWILSPAYGFVAAGLGSALADLFSGYITYAPATFIIKGCMALIAFACVKFLPQKMGKFPKQLIGGVCAELWMGAGYFLFEGILYGFVPSLVNIPANLIQGAAGLLVGLLLIKLLERLKITVDW